jgi:glutamate N-acetyltransferase / amino-acid N-acetyltransferase
MNVIERPAPVQGFRFAGVSAGLKTEADAMDLGLIVADRPTPAAALFTRNRIKAAPVAIARERVRRGRIRAVAVNSGSANCFTGSAGLRLARDSSAAVAREVGCAAEMVIPCATGIIGHLYDLAKYRAGVGEAIRRLSPDGLEDFARAIMTTDTRPKMASAEIALGGATVAIAGAAKGAGMVAPGMATMLAFVVTDAALGAPFLKSALKDAAARSFNAITVDGDMSTNDTVVLMASGEAGNRAPSARDRRAFVEALSAVAGSLARQLVYDGEGATKMVTVEVRRARSAADAERAARRIANSPLVKTAFFGCDPNVGRILAAAGASGAALDPDKLTLRVGGLTIAAGGALVTGALEEAGRRMRAREFSVELDLGLGKGAFTILTTDLSPGYVKLNAEYTT